MIMFVEITNDEYIDSYCLRLYFSNGEVRIVDLETSLVGPVFDELKVIENFKRFYGSFDIELHEGINIVVGDNESGKSTIIEAIYLALTGLYNNKNIKK